ncbi:MAG: family 43 glycosylhydrolase [Paludibacteraceae bacterium]|nr:family 43 glycosylhydrolase [Paludibacteraceae bacterium]
MEQLIFRHITLMLALLLCLTDTVEAKLPQKSNTFRNPVSEEQSADPTVWRDQESGIFYLFSTGPFEKHLMLSHDMVNWEDAGYSPLDESTIWQIYELADKCGSAYGFYAPTVVKNGDKWLMYISLTHVCMIVLESNHADGGFHFKNDEPYILLDEEITGLNITFEDSFVARENDGKWYMMWGSHGKLYRTTLSDDGLSLAENAVFEHFTGNPDKPYKVYEGLYAYYRNGWWYLFAARGQYNSRERPYTVVVGRSRKLSGTFRNRWGFRMIKGYATVIMKPGDMSEYLGGAHTGEIFTDKAGNDYIFYQRQLADVEHYRCLFLQSIHWDIFGWPYFKGRKCQMEDIIPVVQ